MSSAKSWFVQTGFGATLGPMPTDALVEMVRTGALIRTDQVRAGDNDEWRLASEIPDLHDVFSGASPNAEQSLPENATVSAPPVPAVMQRKSIKINLVPPTRPVGAEPPAVPVDAAVATAASAPEPVVAPVSVVRDVPPIVEPPIDDTPVSATAPPGNDLIANWKSRRIQTKEELGLVSLAAEMTQSETQEGLAPELSADLLDDDVPEPAPIVVTNRKPSTHPVSNRPAFLDQVAGLEDGPRVRVETLKEKWDRWRRSLPSWPIAVAVVLVLFMAWSYWPRSHRGIYSRYVAIWEEWKTRRTDFKDKEGWEHFLKQTAAELNDTVPWLEKNARASDREQLLLLWIGRDCFRKMLKQPRQIGSAEEKQLQVLLTKVRELHEPSGSTTLDGGLAGGKNADPEQPTGAGAFDPNTVRAETKPVAPVDPAIPAKADGSPSVAPVE